MSSILLTALSSYALLLLFWAVMALKWRWKHLPLDLKLLALPCVIAAVLLDVLRHSSAEGWMCLRLMGRTVNNRE